MCNKYIVNKIKIIIKCDIGRLWYLVIWSKTSLAVVFQCD